MYFCNCDGRFEVALVVAAVAREESRLMLLAKAVRVGTRSTMILRSTGWMIVRAERFVRKTNLPFSYLFEP
jgi:hypothetical protein